MCQPGRAPRRWRRVLALGAALTASACVRHEEPPRIENVRLDIAAAATKVVVLGTLRGGLVRAEADPALPRRRPACLALIAPQERRCFIVDPGPDLRRQWQLLLDNPALPAGFEPRIDGVVLTDASELRVDGLVELIHHRDGRPIDVVSSAGLLERCRALLGRLEPNGPWNFRALPAGEPVDLCPGLQVSARPSGPGAEAPLFLSFLGARTGMLYAPHVVPWREALESLRDALIAEPRALLDREFVETDGRGLEALVPSATRRARVYLIGLAPDDVLLDDGTPLRDRLATMRCQVLEDGQEFWL